MLEDSAYMSQNLRNTNDPARTMLASTYPIWNSSSPPANPMNNLTSLGIPQFPPSFHPDQSRSLSGNTDPLTDRQYTARRIDPEDLKRIISLYGNQIADIYELGAGQSWMFERGQKYAKPLFTQLMLEAEMELDSASFREKVNKICRKYNALRFNYVYRGLKKPYCVELKDRTADLHFQDLSKMPEEMVEDRLKTICGADCRRSFDLEKDPLLRINVYKLHGENHYAILISQPHINSDGISLGVLIKEILVDYALKLDTDVKSEDINWYKAYAEYLTKIDKQAELAYWKKYLKGKQETAPLPGAGTSDKYEESVHFAVLSDETEKAIRKAQSRYKTTLFNLLQTAWGVTLYRITGLRDIVFGSIASGRESEILQQSVIPGGFIRFIPVRVQPLPGMTFGELVSQVQSEFAQSVQNSDCSPREIQEAVGLKQPVFDHVLNCHNFTFSKAMAKSFTGFEGLKILGSNVYDNLETDLVVYLRPNEEQFSIVMTYNNQVFTHETVNLYCECYQKTLWELFHSEEDVRIDDLERFDRSLFDLSSYVRQLNTLKMLIPLKAISAFQGLDESDLMLLAESTTPKRYLMDEIIIDDNIILDSIPVVAKGKVLIMKQDSKGWYNPLRILNRGRTITLEGFLGKKTERYRAEAFSNDVEVIFIPCKVVKQLMMRYPQIAVEFIKEADDISKIYEDMWIES